MFPIFEDKLSAREITDYWSREIQPRASPNELLASLERAFWLGKIKAETPITRLELLKRIFKWMRRGGSSPLVFVTREDGGPPRSIELADGSLKLDPRPRILVPSNDTDTWSEASCTSAFEVLAQSPSSEYYPEWTLVFLMMKITRDEFMRFLDVHGFDFVGFWRRPTDSSQQPLTPAPPAMIRKAIRDVYERARARGEKPPNTVELVKPVQNELAAKGYKADRETIQQIGNEPEFDGQRLKPGQRRSK
jgi:hypothetical protein